MKKIWIVAIVVVALAVGSAALVRVYRGPLREPAKCEVCQRMIDSQTAFSVMIEGRKVWACCPRCWLTFIRTSHGTAEQPTATDYVGGKMLPAEKCVFVEGSALTPCCGPGTMVGMEKTPAMACFDRCYPSVIAFAKPEEALAFTKEHGGKIISCQTLLDEAKNP
jgi:hypothetical protein